MAKFGLLFLIALVPLTIGAVGQNNSFSYTLWINDDINLSVSTWSSIPSGAKFYDVMVQTAATISIFAFEATEYPDLGYFITKIADYEQEPENDKYWMIYILDELPDRQNPPSNEQLSPLGVSSLPVKDGKNYLFWLKTVKP